jgi:hypothetical protein
MRYFILAIALLKCGTVMADVYIIAHHGLNLEAGDVKDVFLGEKQTSSGTQLVPSDNKAVQSEFLVKVLHVDKGKYESTWAKKSFREGSNIPGTKPSDQEVIEFVKSTTGGVGYVSSKPGSGVDVVSKF